MEKHWVSPEEDMQRLQRRVIELERQLADSQAALRRADQQEHSTLCHSDLLFVHIRDLILLIRRADGRILDANPAAIRAYGYHREELLALTIRDLRAPDMQERTADHLARADVEGILFETTHRRKDGTTFPVEVSSQGATLDGERILISIIRDASERKQGEAERARLMAEIQQEKIDAQRQAEELHAIIEALHDPVLVYNREGVIDRANASAVRAHGFDPSRHQRQETNRTLVVHYPDDRLAEPDELPSARALKGETVIDERLEITNQQGRNMTVLVTSTPLIVNGVQTGAVSIWHDITARKQVEEQLAYQAVLLSNVQDAVVAADEQFRITYWNEAAEAMFGWTAEEAIGRATAELLQTQVPNSTREEAVKELMANGRYEGEVLYRRKDGVYFTAHVRSAVLKDNQGALKGLVTSIHDITERRRAEAALAESARQLERSNRELEQFAFGASHDLQEPLRKIEAFGDVLLESATHLDPRERNFIERMQNAARRMRAMVDGLLQLSRVNTQGRPFEQVYLSRVTAEVLSDLDHQIRRTGGRVEISELPVVNGDPLQLHLLIQNLIGNALKYHRPDTPPEVRVTARQLSTAVQILVEDHGIGFDPEEAERIFQPFQRLVGISEYEGSGMGLAICRRIVERHGGEITARSEPGKGSVFIVTLPGGREKAEGKGLESKR